ncbi:N-acetyldiaminopimelate deacetylase [Shimazuella sp. AN120528]|uniref:N-acetyldiaminopimelate deacetylase n=1 Tax=Shimazuella soli TaxID=1892854 RepID=UPI001F108CB9|nr:N-acetyldiaminopimelate deacetylase [Shimazuella soli]MCH5585654.1 N-acetyldiaminopimelate deacetylase [Shimazuella soli]
MTVSLDKWIQIRRQLHEIPEPGYLEEKTQAFLLSQLKDLPNIELKTWKTGIIVKVSGTAPRKRIGFRTDMDGLPIQEETGYEFQSTHPGYMHACGHDLHMTIALGLVHHFSYHPVQDDLIFIFQPAEEGPGGAEPMMKSIEFQSWKPDMIFALHIAPEYPVGTIATRPGILFANTSEIHIQLIGKSGHAAYPHQTNDMVVAATQLFTQLQTIVSRNVNPLDSAVLTVGKLTAGTKENIIAGSAELNGTIRTLSLETMKTMQQRVKNIVQGIGTSFQCEAILDWGMQYVDVTNHEAVTKHFMNWVEEKTEYQLVECREAMTGEDFGYFLKEIPGFLFWLGVDTPYGLHHSKITPDEKAIGVGIDTMIRYLEEIGN